MTSIPVGSKGTLRTSGLSRMFSLSFALVPLTALLVFSSEDSYAAGSDTERKVQMSPKGEPGRAIAFDRKEITESDGRKYWMDYFESATYRIPEEYVANVPSSGVAMSMHWPSGRGPRAIPASTRFDPGM